MAPVTHEIDPDADTVVILRNASTVFAAWYEEDNSHVQLEDVGSPMKKMSKKEKKQAKRAANVLQVNIDTHSSVRDVCAANETEPASVAGPSAILHDTLTTSNSNLEFDKSEPEEIHFLVSSRHLMLASPWFKRALTKERWSESGRNEEDGLLHITADSWDSEAFLILLNVFHLRNRRVPRTISLEMLAKIAVLVDYYECGETIELFTAMWMDTLKMSTPVPPTYCRELILWIWTSWVLDVSDCFEQATAVAIKQGEEVSRTLDLLIPDKVLSEIDRKRSQALGSLITQLYDLLSNYRSVSYECPESSDDSFLCGSFLLGALTKELHRVALMPPPKQPFPKLSFNGLSDLVRTMQTPSWPTGNRRDYYGEVHHGCDLNTTVTDIVTKVASAITGLSLSEMKSGKLNVD